MEVDGAGSGRRAAELSRSRDSDRVVVGADVVVDVDVEVEVVAARGAVVLANVAGTAFVVLATASGVVEGAVGWGEPIRRS